MAFDKAKPSVKIDRMDDIKQNKVRKLKAQGYSYEEIGISLGISKQLAHWHGKASKGERICRGCCRPLKKRV